MKQRNFVTTGDSIGTNPVVNTEDVTGERSFLTEDEVRKRADDVLKKNPGKTAGDLLRGD